ncbi:hypothetical protein CJ203_02815 [Corynebacterium tuscaniense]|uniref:Phenol hydroxylase n=1 Tax=Corynebacterium tuscaniense TaxID=302449 RepID=A0A2N6T6L0_9CORY|nr:hypothetical protein [Corynebacterium tuscaniense]PMC64963.1 hypothetical protein CJ203_02815 [Corynebacterium tuscaniense]
MARTEAAGQARDNAGGGSRVRLPRFSPRKSRPQADLQEHEDAWLDSLEDAPSRTGLQGLRDKFYESLGGTGRWLEDAWNFLSTSLGRLLALMIVLSVMLLASGYAMSQSGQSRENALETLLNATEPTSNSAHTLYTSLSQADTLATTSFVQPGLQTAESHRRYVATIDEAVIAADEVVRGSALAGDHSEHAAEVQELTRDIQRMLPQYTGLMERAQANQRVGNPLGVAYMTQASTLMRETMLTKAERLLNITRDQVDEEMRRLTLPQLVPLSGLLAGIAALVFTQWVLWRMFRRRLNRGFLVSTALMLAAAVWVISANSASWLAGTRGFEAASDQFEQLTSARITAQETRTTETLTLLTRRTGGRSGPEMGDTANEVTGALDAVTPTADPERVATTRRALTDWRVSHSRMMAALQQGDYARAVDIAASQELVDASPSTASSFQTLDKGLAELISQSRTDLRTHITNSLKASDSVAPGVMVLTVLAFLMAWLGVRPRIQEYL